MLFQLRTAYLSHIKDGVGERLINVNSTVLNNPAFRAGGWTPAVAQADIIKLTYSPPIPTAITAEYFQAPRNLAREREYELAENNAEEDEGGMVTGMGSNETVGPGTTAMQRERRRRRERREEDDDESSDLSDESEDEEEGRNARPVTQIKFQKMPLRNRAGSSPLRSSQMKDGPSVLVTSPSRPTGSTQLRRGSLGALEAVKERARRDTITSSEMSSENELDSSVFRRKQVNIGRPSARKTHMLSERILEDEDENEIGRGERMVANSVDPGAESDSSLDSDFAGSADSASLMEGDPVNMLPSSPLPSSSIPMPAPLKLHSSPRKTKQAPALLQALPPPRPISVILPVSALTQALKGKDKKPESPFQRFTALSGKGDPNPLWVKIYCPFSKSKKPIELPLRRMAEDGSKVLVAEAIGLALWEYGAAVLEPAIATDKMDVNKWVLRMFEDDEVEYDFPALTRTKPIIDFASNNTRPSRGRMRDKPWDEFALVAASESEQKENATLTPEYTVEAKKALEASTPIPTTPTPVAAAAPQQPPTNPPPPQGVASRPFRNPITGPSFGPSTSNVTLADAPAAPTTRATPRTGPPRTVTVSFTSDELVTRSLNFNVTTDTYLAEVFDRVCRELNVDKALYILKVQGTNTMAPFDRTVEALGSRLHLELQRRRFVTDGAFGLSGSPGSESPGAPLLIAPEGIPKKGKRGLHPLAQASSYLTGLTSTATYKRYLVTRKQPMSFSSSSTRILALDGEYMHIMPANLEKASGTAALGAANNNFLEAGSGKTTTVHFSSVVGSKVSRRHPRMFRVVVYKEREAKRYDFEARSVEEAAEIVGEIRHGVEKFQT